MIILGTNSIKDTGYDVDNSLRFNSGSSDYLTRTPSGTGNRRTWTFSAWVKRTNPGAGNQIFQQSQNGSNYMKLYFSSDKIFWRGVSGGSNSAYIATNRLFRDVSAWYHIVARFDSTNGTAGDRMRLYVNGVEETSFSTDINPSSNYDSFANTTNPIDIGRDNVNNASYFNGYMTEVCMVDGQSLAPDQFGEFDEDSGIWKPIDVSGLTFGTNGFYLDFEDSSALGNDANGSNNFTVNNLTAIDQSTDTCTNNASIINSLDKWSGSTADTSSFLSNGNLDLDIGSSAKSLVRSTIGVTSGKWYWEVKVNTKGKGFFGFCNANALNGSASPHDSTDSRGIFYYDAVPDFRGNSGDGAITTGIASIANGDILNFALDMDNYAFYIGKAGTYMNSGNPTSGSNKTGAISELFTNGSQYLSNYGEVFACLYCSSTSGAIDSSMNFGSPPYAISSGNTDGNGYGNFEYAVPSGYYSLNTKNLSEYG